MNLSDLKGFRGFKDFKDFKDFSDYKDFRGLGGFKDFRACGGSGFGMVGLFLLFRLMMKIAIINGPNLNLLGRRNPDIYGMGPFESTLDEIRNDFSDVEFSYRQSNSEGEIVSMLHYFGFNPEYAGVVLNPGAYAHYSHAIADAVEAVQTPVVEVHISNIFAREGFRHASVTARAASGFIAGCGRDGYALAILRLMRLHNTRQAALECDAEIPGEGEDE